MKKIIFLFIIVAAYFPMSAQAATLTEKLSGRILLQVESHGEAWYVYPPQARRYYLGRPEDAFRAMRELGLGISETNFQKLPLYNKPGGDVNLARNLAGRIVLQVEARGEAWYINPENLKAYYLGRPDDAFRIMRELGLGISNNNLSTIPTALMGELPSHYLGRDALIVTTNRGHFATNLVKISLRQPGLEVLSLAADPKVCIQGVCAAKALSTYLNDNKGFAAINGSYFCTDGDSCGGYNYYFSPVYESQWGVMINRDKLRYPTTGPIVVIDSDNHWHYFKDTRDFISPENFQISTGKSVSAALSNQPRLLENGISVLDESKLDDKQKNTKSLRQALAYKENPSYPGQGDLYLISIGGANLPDVVAVLESLKMDSALNLDGGGSATLIYEDQFISGPGREVPNAIVFKK